jgi:hypothetical protein
MSVVPVLRSWWRWLLLLMLLFLVCAARLAHHWQKLIITALGLTACRHGHVYHALNCFEGERHAYAVVAFSLALEAGLHMSCWWYDINCR